MKDVEPEAEGRFVGPPVTVEPEKALERTGHRLRRAPRVRPPDRRLRQGQAARGAARRQLPQERRIVHNPGGPATSRTSTSCPGSPRSTSAISTSRRYNVPFLLNPFISLLHLARLPGDVHVLPVAADALGPPLAAALGGRRRQRSALGARELPGPARRSSSTTTPSTTRRSATIELCKKLKPLNFTWSLHVARHHRLRHAEGDEGSRLPADDRRLRIGRPADPQEHQEGRHGRHGASASRANCNKLGPDDPRRLHRRAAGRDAREHPPHHRFRQDAGLPRPSRFRSRIPIPGTEFYDYRQAERPDHHRLDDRRDGPPAAERHLSRPGPRRAGGVGGALLRRILLPPEGRLARGAPRPSSTTTSASGSTRKRASTWPCVASARSSSKTTRNSPPRHDAAAGQDAPADRARDL